MGDEIDDRIGQVLDRLQPRIRRRPSYKSDYIARNYEKLERAHRELGWSYKDLAELLTKEGRPTKVPTLKYNMKKIAAQRQGETQSTEWTPITGTARQSTHSASVKEILNEPTAGEIRRFKR